MFLSFFYTLRQHGLPVSLHEYLGLMEALRRGVISGRVEEFYALSRAIFVKQEAHLDRFDRLFGAYFQGLESIPDEWVQLAFPPEWFKEGDFRQLSEEEKALLEKLGGPDALWEKLRELLEEQKNAHSGGNKWVGTGGTSPFGAQGFNPEGFRAGGEGRQRQAIRVWDQRAFKNLDDRIELNTRNLKMILKRLRILTREGLPTELDLDQTIRKTSENGGYLDIALRPSRDNRVKVLLLMDVGGSMDEHVELCEQLFSAARWEFKHLEFFYFHNCVYESVWRDNRRRFHERIPTLQLLHRFAGDYKLILVGDAAMSPYEIFYRGGSVEHYNDEPGIHWLRKLSEHFSHLAWINPLPEYEWDYYESVSAIREFTGNRMFPMTVDGLTQAMRCLKNRRHIHHNQVWEDSAEGEF